MHDRDGRLVYAGRVGTGFDHATLESLGARLRKLERRASPFAADGPRPPARGAHWVKPELVAEVAFTEWTRDGLLRHPAFQGLREDKPAAQIVRETSRPPKPARAHPIAGGSDAPSRWRASRSRIRTACSTATRRSPSSGSRATTRRSRTGWCRTCRIGR